MRLVTLALSCALVLTSLLLLPPEARAPSGTAALLTQGSVFLRLSKETFRSGETLVLQIVNDGSEEAWLGEPYEVQYFHGSGWVPARWLTPSVWRDIAWAVRPRESRAQELSLFPVYAGTYRILKEVCAGSGCLSRGNKITLFATFRVVEATPYAQIPRAQLPEPFWTELDRLCSQAATERRQVTDALRQMLRQQIRQMPDLGAFFAAYGGTEEFFVAVRHATNAFVARWPAQCRDVPLRIEVLSWAVTQPHALPGVTPRGAANVPNEAPPAQNLLPALLGVSVAVGLLYTILRRLRR